MSCENFRAASAVLHTSDRPLVSRSRRLMIEICPPFTISNASSSRSPCQSVNEPSGLLGCTCKCGGLSMTIHSADFINDAEGFQI